MDALPRSADRKVRLGCATDIGGGRENQDSFFCWTDPDGEATVWGVLDGHGREVGRLAATAGRDAIVAWLDDGANRMSLKAAPTDALASLFAAAHGHIKEAFRTRLQNDGWLVEDASEGYLLKRRASINSWSCVHGGTSCSVVALVNGRLFTANVGDSSVLLGRAVVPGAALAAAAEAKAKAGGDGGSSKSGGGGGGGVLNSFAGGGGTGGGGPDSAGAAPPTVLAPIPPMCLRRLVDVGSHHLHDVDVTRPRLPAPVADGTTATPALTGGRLSADANAAGAAGDALGLVRDPLVDANGAVGDWGPSPSERQWDPRLPLPGERLPPPQGKDRAGGADGESKEPGGKSSQVSSETRVAAASDSAAGASSKGWGRDEASEFGTQHALLVTADHSPESPREFERLRRTCPRGNDPTNPALLVVYDSPNGSCSKASCSPVFQLSADDPTAPGRVTNRGKYFKNVRQEWASLVATPPNARFQDALAFTRSLGDLHLQAYGVCSSPEIFEVDLDALLAFEVPAMPLPPAREATDGGNSSSTESLAGADLEAPRATLADRNPRVVLALLACTDGVWDNWQWDDSLKFVVETGHVARAMTDGPLAAAARCKNMKEADAVIGATAAQAAAMDLIRKNARLARANFGSSADNATAVVSFLW